MEAEEPLQFGVIASSVDSSWELQIDFRDEFRELSLEQQGAGFRSYLTRLAMDAQGLPQDAPGHPGMLLVQQLVEQLLPHVETGSLDLQETVRVQIDLDSAVSLKTLMSSHRL